MFLENGWLWKLVNEVGSVPLRCNIIIYIYISYQTFISCKISGGEFWWRKKGQQASKKGREVEHIWAELNYLGPVCLKLGSRERDIAYITSEYASGLKSGTFRRFILVVKEDYCFRTCSLHHIVARLAWRLTLFSTNISGDMCFSFVQDKPVQENKDP